MASTKIFGAPELAQNLQWKIVGYLHGRATRQCPMEMSGFKQMIFIGQSGDYYHFLGDQKTILICTIKIK